MLRTQLSLFYTLVDGDTDIWSELQRLWLVRGCARCSSNSLIRRSSDSLCTVCVTTVVFRIPTGVLLSLRCSSCTPALSSSVLPSSICVVFWPRYELSVFRDRLAMKLSSRKVWPVGGSVLILELWDAPEYGSGSTVVALCVFIFEARTTFLIKSAMFISIWSLIA